MDYFVCTYGNFEGKTDILEESLKEGKYILHNEARYPSAMDYVKSGDVLLLSINHVIVAYGIAKGVVRRVDDNDWRFRVDVEKWVLFDEGNHLNGVSSCGVSWATVIGGAMSVVRKVKSEWAVEKLFYMGKLKELPIMERRCFELSIVDVASWTYTDLDSDSGVVARIPVLQRGLVWSPQQNELLWDSLFRGIPIGALILCPAIMNQSRGLPCTHHILDGQQRCNAIGVGFDGEPFSDGKGGLANKSVLWLDLNPGKKLPQTSRRYVFRVTTPAHPWGYRISDDAGREACLSVPEIRTAQSQNNFLVSDVKLRPYTSEMYPFVSNVPVPVGYLTHSYLNLGGDGDEGEFWRLVRAKCEGLPFQNLKNRVLEFLDDPTEESVRSRSYVFNGLQTAFQDVIVAVNAPREIVDEKEVDEGQSSIEHLFTRINRQGTRLEGDELVYSSIKSYWPEIAESIDKCSQGRMPPSRMLMLALRLLETEVKESHYSWGVGIARVREFANDEQSRKGAMSLIDDELETLCSVVDGWLLFKDGIGFPKVLKTGIANNAAEVYLLLLVLARHNPSISRDFIVKMTMLLYFCDYRIRISRRSQVVRHILWACYNEGFEEVVVRKAIHECVSRENDPWLLPMCDLSMAAVEMDLEAVEYKIDNLQDGLPWWECFERFRCSRQLLLAAEASYIEDQFPDYDPARKDLWAEYNRPWDFDHIAAQNTVNGWPEANENAWWLWCIGNLAAIPLEQNRSKSDSNDWRYYDHLSKKYPECFSVDTFAKVCTMNDVKPVEFRRAAWRRFLTLYGKLWKMVGEFWT